MTSVVQCQCIIVDRKRLQEVFCNHAGKKKKYNHKCIDVAFTINCRGLIYQSYMFFLQTKCSFIERLSLFASNNEILIWLVFIYKSSIEAFIEWILARRLRLSCTGYARISVYQIGKPQSKNMSYVQDILE